MRAGAAAAGETLFNSRCIGCHVAGAASIVEDRARITNDMGTVNAAMTGVTLTDQEVADLQALAAQ